MIAVREYSNASDIIAGAHAVRRRLFALKMRELPPTAIVKALTAPVKIRPRRRAKIKPQWKTETLRFDQHVTDMRKAMAETRISPHSYLKRRCAERLQSYEFVIGPSRTRLAVAIRDSLILEMKKRYPHLSLPQLGRLFGGRDHTTILHALRKQGWSR